MRANTVTKAEDMIRGVRAGVATGVDQSRDRAADMLERAGGAVRSRSRQVGRATERGGERLGRRIEHSARELRPQRSRGLFGYVRRHPMQVLLLLGLVTGVTAVALLPRLAGRSGEGYDQPGPMA